MEDGPTAILLHAEGVPPLRVETGTLAWAALLRAGDSFLANEVDWWIVPTCCRVHAAVALSPDVPMLDVLLRAALTRAAPADILIVPRAVPPRSLRRRAARSGVALLDAAAAAAIRDDPGVQRVGSVEAVPFSP